VEANAGLHGRPPDQVLLVDAVAQLDHGVQARRRAPDLETGDMAVDFRPGVPITTPPAGPPGTSPAAAARLGGSAEGRATIAPATRVPDPERASR